jgi:hypothetical protein
MTAPSGTGKSYAIVCYLVSEILPHTDLTVWHNLPLKPKEIAQFVFPGDVEKQGEVIRRLKRIPTEELLAWRHLRSSPNLFFANRIENDIEIKPLENSIIFLDEAQDYVGVSVCSDRPKDEKDNIGIWMDFISQLRHCSSQIWFITQSMANLDSKIVNISNVRIVLKDRDVECLPVVKIPMADVQELIASFTGKYWGAVKLMVKQRVDDKSFDLIDERQYIRKTSIYKLYDSYNARIDGSGGVKNTVLMEHQKRSHIGMIWWFFRRNTGRMLPGLLKILFIVTLPWSFGYAQTLPVKLMQFTPINKFNTKEKINVEKSGKNNGVPDKAAVVAPVAKEDLTVTVKRLEQSLQQYQKIEMDMNSQLSIKANELKVQTELAEKYNKEIERLQKVIKDSSALKMITDNSITLQNGETFFIGEVIDDEKRTLKEVNFERRFALLSDGSVLRMSYQ